MKTALVKTEKTTEGSKIEIRIVDKIPAGENQYIRNVKIPSLGVTYVAIAVNEATDLFLNPFLFNSIKSLLV